MRCELSHIIIGMICMEESNYRGMLIDLWTDLVVRKVKFLVLLNSFKYDLHVKAERTIVKVNSNTTLSFLPLNL